MRRIAANQGRIFCQKKEAPVLMLSFQLIDNRVPISTVATNPSSWSTVIQRRTNVIFRLVPV
jgi:hypothetical protein